MAHFYRGEPFIRGKPIEIEFLGFRSDTFRLQQAGWQIAEEEDHQMMGFRIAIRHPEQKFAGLSRTVERMRLHHDKDLVIGIDIALQYVVHAHEAPVFRAVDTTPRYEPVREYDLFNEPYFRPIDGGKEIFLREATVEEIMQIALDKQEPEQAEIRARRMQEAKREEYRRGGTTKAKLIAV